MSGALPLPARLDLSAATRLLADLRKQDGPIRLDASSVTHLGALGVQTIVAASRAARARGDDVEINDPSEKMIEQMQIMGVTQEQLVGGSI